MLEAASQHGLLPGTDSLQSKINRLTFNQQRLLDQGIERYVRAIQNLADRAKDAADMNTASSKLSTNLDFKKAALVIG